MSGDHDAVTAALEELERARRLLQRIRTSQVRSTEHRQFFQATALSWFKSRRPAILRGSPGVLLDSLDSTYRRVLDSSERAAAKGTYRQAFKTAKADLVELRAALLAPVADVATSDVPPAFDALARDPAMQAILVNRWAECTRCIGASAPLAATVMMGGLLEALLVARANRLTDKSALFRAQSAPVDPKTKKALDLRQWTLAPYIDVAHELGWITRSAKDVAIVLRDYRNYVHPEKERSHAVTLGLEDAAMFWELVKTLTRQLLSSTA